MLSLYHVCFELGRFPHELPADLPDEQVTLMLAYLSIRNEGSAGAGAPLARQGRVAEAHHQADEAAAWAAVGKG